MESAHVSSFVDERRKFVNWSICWILLPLAPFIPLWFIGGPPRYPEILLIAGIGLAVRRSNYVVRLSTLLFLLAYSGLAFVAGLFNLSIFSLVTAVRYLNEMQPSASGEYIFVVFSFCIVVMISSWSIKLENRFESTAAIVCCVVLATACAGIDYWSSFSARGSYKRSAPGDSPFSSAVIQSNFFEISNTKQNVLIVMVESMGLPTDPKLNDHFMRIWKRPEFDKRYDIKTGSTPFFGSTTNGEMRELCGRWADYEDVDDFRASCLPALLAKKGYRTTALHSFDGSMFDRAAWYPRIGFQKIMFGPDLVQDGTGYCPGVFPGACDRNVPPVIGKTLIEGKGPQFVYWLTVNSHLPVPDAPGLKTASCEKIGLPEERPMVCRMFSIWGDVSQSLSQLLMRPDLPPTDVLIVGDHMPPFFDRKSRVKFDPTRVPWVLLKYRGEHVRYASLAHNPDISAP